MGERAVIACRAAMAASISEVRSEYLGNLLNRVQEMMANTVASSMAKGYNGHWARWVKFAAEHGVHTGQG